MLFGIWQHHNRAIAQQTYHLKITHIHVPRTTLLKTQKPIPKPARAWCPGGRTRQYALRMLRARTASTAAKTPPALREAMSYPPER